MQKENKLERMYPITAKCKDCGKEFSISVREQLFAKEDKGFVLPKRCEDCRKQRKGKSKQIICMDCGDVFEFSANEQKFYQDSGFQEPRRCKTCRKIRKDNHSDGQNITKENK